ncbi:SPOR domain-containing protein [Colwelliaceae bacterium 6471]
MKKFRFMVLFGLVISSSGCATLQLASLTFTSVSYMVSGKSMSDHVISAVRHQDCAMHRALMNQQVCHTITNQPERLLAKSPISDQEINDTPSVKTASMNSLVSAKNKPQPDDDNASSITPRYLPQTNVYLVVGSFNQWQFAQKRKRYFNDSNAQVVNINKPSNSKYRVVIGPITENDIDKYLAKLPKIEHYAPWQISLCHDSMSPPPCNGTLLAKTEVGQ